MQPVTRRVLFASHLNLAAPLRDTIVVAGLTFAPGACARCGRQLPASE
jgi:hypothetical protein